MTFGLAEIKAEGSYIGEKPVGPWPFPTLQNPPTTYVERRVPTHLKVAAHGAIDQFLRANGYDPEQL